VQITSPSVTLMQNRTWAITFIPKGGTQAI
jgi:hypothetical protein